MIRPFLHFLQWICTRFNCFYQDKHINKAKGSGVALYLKDELNGVVNEELSCVTKNLETLFITIQHDEPLHVGVLYRPPSGNASEALIELINDPKLTMSIYLVICNCITY